MPDVNLNEGVDAANKQRAAGTSLISSQKAENQDYLSRYRNALAGQEKQTALAGRLSSELGLDKARGATSMLNTTINNMPGVLKTASVGKDINSNQLQRLTSARLAPLQSEYANASALQSSLEGQLNQRLGYEVADQQKELLPYQTEQSLMQSTQGNEIGMFTSANQNELNAINQKISSGVQISEGEKNRAQQLELQKMADSEARARAEMSSSSSPYTTLSEGQTLYNTATGTPVYTAKKTKVPTSGGGGFNLSAAVKSLQGGGWG